MTPRDPRVFFYFLFIISLTSGSHISSIFHPSHLIMSESILAPVKILANHMNNMSLNEYRARKVALITGKILPPFLLLAFFCSRSGVQARWQPQRNLIYPSSRGHLSWSGEPCPYCHLACLPMSHLWSTIAYIWSSVSLTPSFFSRNYRCHWSRRFLLDWILAWQGLWSPRYHSPFIFLQHWPYWAYLQGQTRPR